MDMTHILEAVVPIYDLKVTVFIGAAIECRLLACETYGDKLSDESKEFILDSVDGYFSDSARGMSFIMKVGNSTRYCIWLESFNGSIQDWKTLTHELQHHPSQALGSLGMIRSDDSEEAYAYYSEWVAEQIMRFAQDKGLVKFKK
jgi:hypothetical protein